MKQLKEDLCLTVCGHSVSWWEVHSHSSKKLHLFAHILVDQEAEKEQEKIQEIIFKICTLPLNTSYY